MPRTYLQRIAREAIAIEQEKARDAGALGYTARLLVPRRLRDSFLRQATRVLRLYPAANVAEGRHGLVFSPVARQARCEST